MTHRYLGSGLLDPDCVAFRTVKVKRSLTWEKFNSRISEYFGVPDSTFRIWIFKRKNDSEVWRPEPLEEEDVDQRELKDVSIRSNKGMETGNHSVSYTYFIRIENLTIIQSSSLKST